MLLPSFATARVLEAPGWSYALLHCCTTLLQNISLSVNSWWSVSGSLSADTGFWTGEAAAGGSFCGMTGPVVPQKDPLAAASLVKD